MGKLIIIKGADFAENAVIPAELPSSLEITGLLPNLKFGYITKQINKNWSIQADALRTTLQEYVDVSSLKQQYGFTHARVECLIANTSAIVAVIGDASSVASWDNQSWPLGNHTEISVNFNKGSFSASQTSDACKVFLYREE